MIKKFRIWDAFQKKMSYGDENKDLTVAFTNGKLSEVSLDDNERSCVWSAVPIDLERRNRYFAQQWTGLTDSVGREIYEGDIVLRRGKNKEVRFGEFWDGVDIGNGFFLQTSDRKLSYRNFGTNKILSFNESKVIGNIFQAPELLEKC